MQRRGHFRQQQMEDGYLFTESTEQKDAQKRQQNITQQIIASEGDQISNALQVDINSAARDLMAWPTTQRLKFNLENAIPNVIAIQSRDCFIPRLSILPRDMNVEWQEEDTGTIKTATVSRGSVTSVSTLLEVVGDVMTAGAGADRTYTAGINADTGVIAILVAGAAANKNFKLWSNFPTTATEIAGWTNTSYSALSLAKGSYLRTSLLQVLGWTVEYNPASTAHALSHVSTNPVDPHGGMPYVLVEAKVNGTRIGTIYELAPGGGLEGPFFMRIQMVAADLGFVYDRQNMSGNEMLAKNTDVRSIEFALFMPTDGSNETWSVTTGTAEDKKIKYACEPYSPLMNWGVSLAFIQLQGSTEK
jgi:hypothetical protein